MRIDSHIHLFLDDGPEYPWDPQAAIKPTYSAPLDRFIAEMQTAQVDKAVVIQHSCYGYDNRYILDCVQRVPDRLCAVVKVDPLAAEAPAQLETLAQQPGVRGLRLQPVAQPNSTWLADKKTFPLWETAASHDLAVGILLDPHQLAMAESVIRAFPQVTVIIDHMGRLNAQAAPDDESFQRLLNLSVFDKVFVKLSGFYAFSQQPYPYLDLQSKTQALFQAFGASRLMWASDYPLLIHAGESYPQAIRILDHQIPDLSSADHDQIMAKTASAVFRL